MGGSDFSIDRFIYTLVDKTLDCFRGNVGFVGEGYGDLFSGIFSALF